MEMEQQWRPLLDGLFSFPFPTPHSDASLFLSHHHLTPSSFLTLLLSPTSSGWVPPNSSSIFYHSLIGYHDQLIPSSSLLLLFLQVHPDSDASCFGTIEDPLLSRR